MPDRDSSEQAGTCLKVSGRAVGQFWQVAPESVLRAAEAGLLRRCGNGFDAAHALELAQRTLVRDEELRAFPARSVLLVQQSPIRWHAPGSDDALWRPAYGFSTQLTLEESVWSASGWWPVDPDRRDGVRGIVATVASFVVTVAVVDPGCPVLEEHDDGRVRFAASAATTQTPEGRAMLRVFGRRRLEVRRGSSFLIP